MTTEVETEVVPMTETLGDALEAKNRETWVLATPSLTGRFSEGFVRGWASAAGQGVFAGWIVHRGDSDIRRGRNKCVAGYLGTVAFQETAGLMFLDDDIGWNVDQVLRAAGHGLPIVGGCYPKKTDDPVQRGLVFRRPLEEHPFIKDLVGVKGAGTGWLMIRRRVLEALTQSAPVIRTNRGHYWDLFRQGVDPEDGDYLSEDYGFCQIAREAGFDVWIDRMIRATHDDGRRVYQCADACQEPGGAP